MERLANRMRAKEGYQGHLLRPDSMTSGVGGPGSPLSSEEFMEIVRTDRRYGQNLKFTREVDARRSEGVRRGIA